MMRKHIISMAIKDDDSNLPFFSWECITIQTKQRDIYLVIRNEKLMADFIKFLIHSIKTVDGNRGTSFPVLKALLL